MRKFVISSDTTCDLPVNYVKEHDIDIHSLYYRFGDDVYGGERQLTAKEFFDRVRAGEMPTTMATNPEESKELFKKRVEKGEDVLHIAFSSALSSSYQNACIAANEIMEEYPDARIVVIDSKAATMGEGIIVYKAIEKMKNGCSMDECIEYVNSILNNVAHHFTVDDLFHLQRGGRVSKATAVVGTLAGIKPNLCVNEEGGLEPYTKVRGRKKALSTLVDTMDKLMGSYRNKDEIVMIVHDDTTEDANVLAAMIKERFGMENIMMNEICPTIGAHTGPGVVGAFFMADSKK